MRTVPREASGRILQSEEGQPFQNPGGGFAICPTWGSRGATCGIDAPAPDQLFQLLDSCGSIVCTGSCPDSGVILNEGFETGDFTSWVIDGTSNAPVVNNLSPHSGTFAALAGNLVGPPEPSGDSSFYQQFAVPAAGGTLSFWHQAATTARITFDWQDAYITNSAGAVLQTILSVCYTDGGT